MEFTKAFDLVSRHILLNNLETIGIRGVALQLFKSSLTIWFSKLESLTVETRSVKSGILQGSAISENRFIVFINNLMIVSKLDKYVHSLITLRNCMLLRTGML